jgi:hypothetical protein
MQVDFEDGLVPRDSAASPLRVYCPVEIGETKVRSSIGEHARHLSAQQTDFSDDAQDTHPQSTDGGYSPYVDFVIHVDRHDRNASWLALLRRTFHALSLVGICGV